LLLCSAFLEDVENYTSGKPNDNPSQTTFLRHALPSYRSLKAQIEFTRPRFGITPAKPGIIGVPVLPPPLFSMGESMPRECEQQQAADPGKALTLAR